LSRVQRVREVADAPLPEAEALDDGEARLIRESVKEPGRSADV
jgi:hypothetical protein